MKSGVNPWRLYRPLVSRLIRSGVRMERRILIVDDDHLLSEMLRDRFQAMGYEVLIANDGHSALALVSLEGTRALINGILLDINMPGLDGLAVLRELRTRHPCIPVLMMSATDDREIIREAVRLGAKDYIHKPIDNKILEHKCTEIFSSRGDET